jgi:glycogen debranching enzyme
MGPFITAYIKVNEGAASARQQAEEWLAALQEHLSDAGLGHISEIFDGNAPQRPVGCIAQAWSVAEILRTLVEDVRAIEIRRPPTTLTPAVPELANKLAAV